MNYTKRQFEKLLIENSPSELSNTFVFSGTPWLFASDSEYKPICDYDRFREIVANSSKVETGDVFLTGSSIFGRSTNPRRDRFNRAFGSHSDIDVVIISQKEYGAIWRQLYKAYYSGYPKILKFNGANIFRGFVTEPETDYKSTILTDLIKRMNDMKRELKIKAGISLEVRYRIYRTVSDAREYQIYGFEKCRRLLRP